MKQNIAILALTGVLILAGISIYALTSENKALSNETSEQKKQIEELNNEFIVQDNGNATSDVQNKIEFIQEAFNVYFNYTTDTYDERLSGANNYFTQDVLGKLQGAGESDKPSIKVTSELDNPTVYINPIEPNEFAFATKINYQVEDNPVNPFYSTYRLHLSEEDGSYVIDNVDVYSGQPTME
ncbi:MAG: hypothetical protein ACTIH5_11575 [Lactococcus cremoris]